MTNFDKKLEFWNEKIQDKNFVVIHTETVITGNRVSSHKTVIVKPLELFTHPFDGCSCVCPTQAHGLSSKAEYFFDELSCYQRVQLPEDAK